MVISDYMESCLHLHRSCHVHVIMNSVGLSTDLPLHVSFKFSQQLITFYKTIVSETYCMAYSSKLMEICTLQTCLTQQSYFVLVIDCI